MRWLLWIVVAALYIASLFLFFKVWTVEGIDEITFYGIMANLAFFSSAFLSWAAIQMGAK